MKPIDYTDVPCQEVVMAIGEKLIRCAAPAVGVCWHAKDARAYPMCASCLDHNVRNRGGKLLGLACT